jgi:hypothetical protein
MYILHVMPGSGGGRIMAWSKALIVFSFTLYLAVAVKE